MTGMDGRESLGRSRLANGCRTIRRRVTITVVLAINYKRAEYKKHYLLERRPNFRDLRLGYTQLFLHLWTKHNY
mgnify:CR=1 FL=1